MTCSIPSTNGVRDEAVRALATFAEEFPEMTEPELCAWIIERFRY